MPDGQLLAEPTFGWVGIEFLWSVTYWDIIVFSADYTTIDEYGAAYKYHKEMHPTTLGANLRCLSEGAQLFYPTDRSEGDAVFAFLNNPQVDMILIGIQKTLGQQQYITVDG
jgi:hypothetical protein